MRIALAQLNFHTGYFKQNTRQILGALENARQQNADLLVCPELAICGYPPRDFLEFRHFIDSCEAALKEIADHCRDIAAIIGTPSLNAGSRGKKLHNSAYFLGNGTIRQKTHKALLPTYDVFDEYRYFEPGEDFQIVAYNGYRIALTICEDIWNTEEQPLYTDNPMAELARYELDLAINIAASPFSQTQAAARQEVLQANAREYKIPFFYVNHVGAQTELIFDGGSCVMNSQGQVTHQMPFFEEAITTFDLNAADRSTQNPQLPGPYEKLHEALVLGIQDYFRKLGFQKAVIGLSGGIDSALVLALTARALGEDNVLGVLMPSPYTSQSSVDDALALCENLGVAHQTIPINAIFEQYKTTLQPLFEGYEAGLAEENLQARSRAMLLMAISNKFGHILLNTSNKSELGVGYGTLYGDLCGGISVLGDVYKMEVFALARYVNKAAELIPENIITKPPTAELKANQKDTDFLPPYETLDPILHAYIEKRKGPEELINEGYNEDQVRKILKMANQSEFKRHQAPPILRVSDKAFGMGRRLPIVAKYLS